MKCCCKWSQPFHSSTGLGNQSLMVTRSVPFLHHSESAFHLLLLQSFSSACDPVCWLDDVKNQLPNEVKTSVQTQSWFVSVSLRAPCSFLWELSFHGSLSVTLGCLIGLQGVSIGLDHSDTSTTTLLRLPLPSNSQGF